MPDWNHFPLWEPRHPEVKRFKKKQRPELELAIAYQVSDLLSRHGKIEENEVDMSASPDFDEPTTFNEITLDEFPLEDGGDLIIGQLPYSSDGFWTNAGAHSVCKDNEDGVPETLLTVWDPSINAEMRIHDERGKVVGRMVLQELYEALSIITIQIDTESLGNTTPLRTSEYPAPVIEPDFLALVSQFES